MRRLKDGDRLIASEATAALKDAPEATLVLEGTEVTEQSDTEIDVAAGEILVDRDVVDVTQTVETLDLPEAAGGDETHYRYVTVSRDDQGVVVLTNGAVGTIDAEGEISGPVPAQAHPEGNVYLATVLVDEDRILDIYDGRALLEFRVEDFRTQGDTGQFPVATDSGTLGMEYLEGAHTQGGSGTVPVSQGDGTVAMDAGEGSNIDADTVRGTLGVPSDGVIAFDSETGNIPSGWLLADGNNGTPDLRDRFLTGAGNSYTLGQTGGESTVTLSESELASHEHDYYDMRSGDGSAAAHIRTAAFSADLENEPSTDASGGDSAHENRPPFYAVNWIVKA